ncbi:MAG TPA: hypothetical protein QF753_15810 [Victivallales bacterium]|nr:hypothetical protein [Victivallales bacterium]
MKKAIYKVYKCVLSNFDELNYSTQTFYKKFISTSIDDYKLN